MPEYGGEEREGPRDPCIPSLFPARLLDSCLARVESLLYRAGTRLAAQHSTHSEEWSEAARNTREFLSTLLAGPVLDSLAESARQMREPAGQPPAALQFCLATLCGDRLTRLVLEYSGGRESWAGLLRPDLAPVLAYLAQCSGLHSLYLHHLATDGVLGVVAATCSRLATLDISHSARVTDAGLLKLPPGCPHLRELYYSGAARPTAPRTTAALLASLPLQVCDIVSLHPGIALHCTAGPASPLALVHYTGSDRLGEVLHVCPKLRTFKLFVTESLPELGLTLAELGHTLDSVTLVWGTSTSLTGFPAFLQHCGRAISRLAVECGQEMVVTAPDLVSIATHCTQLESLSFSHFHLASQLDPRVSQHLVPTTPANFPFLTHIRLNNVEIEQHGKEVFRFLLGEAHDLEVITVAFQSNGYFFSDFLLDDILATNSLAHLQEFSLRDGALTLISALRLITSRPKLRVVGRLLHWDVEPSELTTFIQILRKAKSLNLLQDITIV